MRREDIKTVDQYVLSQLFECQDHNEDLESQLAMKDKRIEELMTSIATTQKVICTLKKYVSLNDDNDVIRFDYIMNSQYNETRADDFKLIFEALNLGDLIEEGGEKSDN